MTPGFPKIVDDLYAGTMDDAAWDRAFIGIADTVRASDALLLAFNPADGALLREEHHRLDPRLLDDYRQYWTFQDCRREYFLRVPVGCPVTVQSLQIPEWLRTPFLNEFLLPADVPHFMPVWLRKSATKAVTLSLQGTRKRGPFDARDIESLREIVPHVNRALEIRDRLEAANFRTDALGSCINCVTFGVIALGVDGKILHANITAEQILRREERIRVATDRTLILNDVPLPQLWRRARDQQQERLVHIERGPGRWPISVTINAVPELPVRWVSADPAYVLLVFDPERHIVPRSELLARELDITTREAEVAVLLAMGSNVSQVAQRLSVSIHTARTHLKAIYAKTGIRSQAELVRRVATGPAGHAPFSSVATSRRATPRETNGD